MVEAGRDLETAGVAEGTKLRERGAVAVGLGCPGPLVPKHAKLASTNLKLDHVPSLTASPYFCLSMKYLHLP